MIVVATMNQLMRRKLNSFVFIARKNLWRFNWKKIYSNSDSIRIDRPIFLLGTQGGGLTLISRILRRSSNVVCCAGNSKHWNGDDEMHNALAARLPDTLRLAGHPQFENDLVAPTWRYASNHYIDYFRKTASDVVESDADIFRRVIRELILLHAKNASTARFIDKSQTYTLKIPYIASILRSAAPRFLLVTRNPYAMCKRAQTSTAVAKLPVSETEKMIIAAQHWSNSMKQCISDGQQVEHFKVIKFEDFLLSPEKQLRELCDFLEIPFGLELLPSEGDHFPIGGGNKKKWWPLRTDLNDRYLKDLTEGDVSLIKEYCGDLAEQLEYSPDA